MTNFTVTQRNPTRDSLIQKRDELSRQIISFQEQIKTFEEDIRKIESVLPLFPEPVNYSQFPGLVPSHDHHGLSQVIGQPPAFPDPHGQGPEPTIPKKAYT